MPSQGLSSRLVANNATQHSTDDHLDVELDF